MENLVDYFLKKPVVALVGATNNERKYGNIIFRFLKNKGYHILPVNPRAETVDGDKAYHSLEEVSKASPGLLVYVIPPKHTLESLKIAKELDLKNVWIQPGAGDEEVRLYLEKNGFNFLMNDCVMARWH